MICLEAYRVRIGMFYGRSRHNIKNNATFENVDATAFLRIYAIFAIIFILALNLNFATFKLLKLLVDGDIESNQLLIVVLFPRR